MKKILFAIGFFALLTNADASRSRWITSGRAGSGGGGGSVQTASDTFDTYADTALLGAQTNWSNVVGSIIIRKPSTDGYFMGNVAGDCVVRYTAGTWNVNQASSVTLGGVEAQVNFIGAAVRCDASGNSYFFVAVAGNVYLNKFNASSGTNITSVAATLNVGDVMRIEVTGTGSSTRLVVKQNGTVIIASIDPGGTYINAGTPGVATSAAGSVNEMGGTNWAATDI